MKKTARKNPKPVRKNPVKVAAKNPAPKPVKRNPRKVVKRNPAPIGRRRVTPLRRNPVEHWAIIALTKKQGKLYYFTGKGFSSSRRAARQYPTRADALKTARKILPRLPAAVHSLTTREIAA